MRQTKQKQTPKTARALRRRFSAFSFSRFFFFSFFFLILIGVFLAFLSRERCQSLHVLERFTFQRFLSDVYSFFFLDSHRFCFSISLSLSLSLSLFGANEIRQKGNASMISLQFYAPPILKWLRFHEISRIKQLPICFQCFILAE